MALFKDYDYLNKKDKCGVSFNGVDILDLDPNQVGAAIASLPEDQKEIATALIKDRAGFSDIPEDYAKEAGRPSLKEKPYMTCENDGYPYLKGHAGNCDGGRTYSLDIYTKPSICWCLWICTHNDKEFTKRRKAIEKAENKPHTFLRWSKRLNKFV